MAEISTGYTNAKGDPIVWDTKSSADAKRNVVGELIKVGVAPQTIKNLISQNDANYKNDATYREAADKILKIDEQFTELSSDNQTNQTNQGISAITPSRSYSIYGVDWNPGADIATKQGYVQTLLAKGITPTQIKAALSQYDSQYRTDAAYRTAADSLLFPAANTSTKTTYTGTAVSGPTATGSGLSTLKVQNQERPVYKDATFGFRAPYEAPTELAPAKGLGQLVSQYVGQPNLRTMTRSIGPGGMGVLTEQPSAGLSYATRPGGIGEPQYFQNIADYFSDPTITPQSTAYEMYRYNIPETDIQAAIGMTPTEFFAQRAAQQVQPAAPTVTTNTGISALAPPPISYEKPGFSTPFTGGLSFAMQPGGIGRTQYLNNIASYLNKGVSPGSLAADMAQYGVTSDDLIAARAMFPGGAPSQAGMPISIATSTETTETPKAPLVQGGRAGGPIALAEGGKTEMAGEKKFSFEDFGLTPATVELARKQGVFDVPRNVVFGPELKGLEAAALANMSPEEQEAALRHLMIRQGLTGREYFPESMFESTSVAPAIGYIPGVFGDRDRDEKGRPLRAMYRYAEGGGVGRGLGSIAMKGYAQEMAQKGRFGDTMLAHISPEEAQMLQAAGGAGTINPQTGLPEYFSWRKLLKGVGKALPFVLPFTGIGLGAQALISGLSGAVSGGKGFDFKRGLMSGLMSYGMGSLAQGAGAASGVSGDIPITPSISNIDPAALESMSREAVTSNLAQQTAAQQATQAANAALPKFGNVFDSSKGFLPQLGENIQAVGRGGMEAAMGDRAAQEAFTAGQGSVFGKQLTPTMAAGAAAVGMGGVKAADEMNAFQAQQAALTAKSQEEKQYYEDLLRRLMGGFAGGGEIAAMVAGGATGPANEPRTINGAGDGMSDSVPATIEGVQEARLADGEFVIPADVVADLGNGSSNAGSKKLYAMMDRVRKARHGTTRQPPEVDTGRLMPA